MKIRVLLNGCNGKMGHVISQILENSEECSVVAGIDLSNKQSFSYPVFLSPAQCDVESDVIIDFSNPIALPAIIKYSRSKNVPIVISTTGLTDEIKKEYLDLSKTVPVFVSANMSLGINILIELAKKATSILYPEFDIEIVEAHHNQKLDAPSGTALMIADAINETANNKMEYEYNRSAKRSKRQSRELGIHSIRGGTIVGDHTVYFAGQQEVIEITHRAQSREVFARGAIAAAKFLASKAPGLYSMKELIG